ncbi:class I SAM-dependent methyltransferase, partial [Streptomyces sp. NPDC048415]|uniref:class I SAM-dependent methyltransferase n=1 Tax=Streptomyces sp. NPDC048415 TaxID=3154822 RepID=UPI00341AA22D
MALVIAGCRSIETGSPSPLIRDPYASWFVGAPEVDKPIPASASEAASTGTRSNYWKSPSSYIAIRTRVDAFLQDAVSGGVRQVVVLGAGLDTRSVRLSWPTGVKYYEIDQPDVLAFKAQVLRAHGVEPQQFYQPVASAFRLGGVSQADRGGPWFWPPAVKRVWLGPD